jgi:hypothetical protein
MNRYPNFIRYLVILLAVLYAVTDGDLPGTNDRCSHSCPLCEGCGENCPDDPCQHECEDDDDEFAVLIQRSDDESVNLLQNFSVGFVSVVPAKCPPEIAGFRDVISVCPSALSLHLYLSYGSLLI